MKKFLLSLAILVLSLTNIAAVYEIDAEKNAYCHNNLGVNYLRERDYYSAKKEFEIAIQLNPNTQATAVYYNNLGRTYIITGYYKMAQVCFEKAIIQNPTNFDNYLNLVKTFKGQGILEAKLKEYKAKKGNPLNDIMVGVMYVQKGQLATGVTVLDNFCNKEPDLLITNAVKNYIKSNTPKKRKQIS